ncbi:MAG: flagellar basal body rod protein FlgB [candidate division Zixibacteria bacterium]|jgi:flagellar basal-body rod protein FlgB|nr:flagellar basal body rod protein FlgB [candidate division Zixibacteria bacterium]
MENKLTQMIFSKVGVPQYRNFLNLTSLRHKLISSNVANVSTPGYESQGIDFQKEIQRANGNTSHLVGYTTDAGHLPLGQHPQKSPRVHSTNVEVGEMNSVDIDQEVTRMAENELMFTVAARLLQKKFDGLRKAITSR